jgi:site-specific recombinase XerD
LNRVTDKAVIVSPASAVSDLPGVLARGEEHFRVYTEAAKDAFAKNTEKAVLSDTAQFAAFAAGVGASPMPAAPGLVCAYIDHAVARGHRPSTISRRISSISHWHRAHGWKGDQDPTKHELVRLRLRAIRRQLGTRQKQAQAVGEAEVNMILGAHPKPNLRQTRDIAALLLARTGLLRRSELIAADWEDLEVMPDGTGRLLVRKSKVDQEGLGAVVHVSRRAMTWLQRWRTAAGLGADATGPLPAHLP